MLAWMVGTKVPIAQLPTGTGTAQVALGSHTHPALQGIYPISAYGFFTASGPLETFTGNSSLSSIFVARVFIPAGNPIVGAGTIVRSAGTVGAGGINGFAIYNDSGTLVTSTTSDNTLWSTAGWRTKAFAAPVAVQANDRFVYAAVLVSGYSTPPDIIYNVIGGGVSGVAGGGYSMPNHRRSFYAFSVTSWPASFNPLTYGSDAGGYTPFIALA